MTKTRSQLVDRALQKLKVVGAGQPASAADTALVDGLVDPVMTELQQSEIYAWGNQDEIDDAAFEHIAELLASAAASDFGKTGLSSEERWVVERRLRRLSPYVLSGQPQVTEYF